MKCLFFTHLQMSLHANGDTNQTDQTAIQLSGASMWCGSDGQLTRPMLNAALHSVVNSQQIVWNELILQIPGEQGLSPERTIFCHPLVWRLYFGQSRFLVGKDIITARACGALAGGSGITPVISTLQDIWQAAIRRIRGQKLALHGPNFGKTFYTFLDCLFCCRSCGKCRVCPSTFPCLQEKSMMSIPKHSSRTDLNDCKQIGTIQNHT